MIYVVKIDATIDNLNGEVNKYTEKRFESISEASKFVDEKVRTLGEVLDIDFVESFEVSIKNEWD